MNIIALVIVIAIIVLSLSFQLIRKAAHRPANGELETLARISRAIAHNQDCTRKYTTQ